MNKSLMKLGILLFMAGCSSIQDKSKSIEHNKSFVKVNCGVMKNMTSEELENYRKKYKEEFGSSRATCIAVSNIEKK